MENKKYYIFSNGGPMNDTIVGRIDKELGSSDWTASDNPEEADIVFCLGGDGALLRLTRMHGFLDAPIVGINTGHLGYYQEIEVDKLDLFFEKFKEGNYKIQEYIGIEADVYDVDGNRTSFVAINEVVIRGEGERLMHLDLSVQNRHITKFSGDGILLCTPSGSTAYNYSLGGALVDPSVDLIQITPMAPVNNTLYKSFHSSIVIPLDTEIVIVPDRPTPGDGHKNVVVIEDGGITVSGDVRKIVARLSEKRAKIVRLRDYDFWTKVKDKITG